MDHPVESPPLPDAPVRSRGKHARPIWPWLLLVVLAVAGLIVWRAPWQQAPAGGPGPGRPAGAAIPAVAVATAAKGEVPVILSSLGTVTSLATVTVKSQLSGYLTEIRFREGQTVAKGDVLAQVDPRPYAAALAQYQGQLERDQALLDNARLDLARYQRLIRQDSTSKQTVDTAEATVRQYEGTVRTDQALVDTQQLNLDYARITAPIDGRVGLRQVDVGNYVTAGDTSGIVLVTQTSPISVLFTLPEDDLGPLLQRLGAGAQPSVTLLDRANTTRLAEGTLATVDNQIDTSTGTVKLRAAFANADGSLFPNQFVNVALLLDELHDVVVVPAAAVQTGTPGSFVWRLNEDGTVSLRKVALGPSADGRVAILSGLAAGERVVVDGADRLSDGAKVRLPEAPAARARAAEPGAHAAEPGTPP